MNMIGFLIWAPLLLITFITCIIFMITGYKRGIFGALLYLCITFAACFFSALLAKLLSDLFPMPLVSLAGKFSGFIGEYLTDAELVSEFISALGRGIATCVIYLIVFPVIHIIFRIVGGRYIAKIEKGKSRFGKFLGLVTGIANAVVFTMLMLAPVYGATAAGAGIASGVGRLTGTEGVGIVSALSSADRSLPVKTAEEKPYSLIFDYFFTRKIDGAKTNVADLLEKLVSAEGLDGIRKAVKENDIIGRIIDDVIPGGSAIIDIADDLNRGGDAVQSVRRLLDTDKEALKKASGVISGIMGISDGTTVGRMISAITDTVVPEEKKDEEAEHLAYLLSVMSRFDKENTEHIGDLVDDKEKFVYSLLKSDIAFAFVKSAAPDIGKMSDGFREEAKELISGYAAEDPELVLRAEELLGELR